LLVEITYSLTSRDLMALDFYVVRRQLLRPRLDINNGSLLFLVLFFTAHNYYLVTKGEPFGIWVFKPIGLLLLLLAATIGELVLRRVLTPKTNPELLALRTDRFEPEGILVQTEKQTTLVRWLNIQKIENFGNHLFLSYGANRAIFIPHTAFPTSEALAEFTANLQSLHEKYIAEGIVEESKTTIAASPGCLEISFTLELEDSVAIQRLISRRKSVNPWVLAVVFSVIGLLILGGIAFYFYGIWRDTPRELPVLLMLFGGALFAGGAIVGVAFGISKWRQRRQKRNAASAPAGILQKHTIRLDSKGFFHADITGEAFVPWNSIHAVLEDAERIYLLTSPETGCPVPRRVFASPADMREFLQFALSRWRNRGATEGTDNPW
jgi:hypothetical protein